jgi:hypothetical protein
VINAPSGLSVNTPSGATLAVALCAVLAGGAVAARSYRAARRKPSAGTGIAWLDAHSNDELRDMGSMLLDIAEGRPEHEQGRGRRPVPLHLVEGRLRPGRRGA